MIKNERQYRITKTQASRFEDALRHAGQKATAEKTHPLLQKAQIDALRSQLEELHDEIAEYESLRSGVQNIVEAESFDDLPNALIKARIVAGLSQKELADRLSLKEQQIQRYEATNYASASFARLREVVRALGISVREDIFVPTPRLLFAQFPTRLEELGFTKDFIKRRMLVAQKGAEMAESGAAQIVHRTARSLHRIFGWTLPEVFGEELPTLARAATETARFKVPAQVNSRQLNIYTIYAHHLANLALGSTPGLAVKPVPLDPTEVARRLRSDFGNISLDSVLRYVWSLGIVVLPLDDRGAFHGACWRIKGRNVIVLKQQTRSNARWLFDLLHELWHVGQEPEMPERTILELSDAAPERYQNDEERKASRFAGSVLLEGRAEDLVSKIVRDAQGEIARFKSVLPKVAAREHVSVGALANYLAFRLALQNENWWGAASNLQTEVERPFSTVRDKFLERADFSRLDPTDREIMARALSEICEEVK